MKLGVNIDHIATVRQSRRGIIPDPVKAAVLAKGSGADSIVCHLREDRRHIQEEDVRMLKEIFPRNLNLEMGLADDIIKIALQVKPWRVTIVPEKRQELTTEGGLDVARGEKRIGEVAKRFKREGVNVSLFIDPDVEQINASKKVGVDIIELHTGRYANAKNEDERIAEIMNIENMVKIAKKLHFYVAAGHGLNYENTHSIAKIRGIQELNIGHSIIARAIFVGISRAVREMKILVSNPLKETRRSL